MDIVEERKIALNDNIIRKAEGKVNSAEHQLCLHREPRQYVITLYSKSPRARVTSKAYWSHKSAQRAFSKMTAKHGFEEKIDSNVSD